MPVDANSVWQAVAPGFVLERSEGRPDRPHEDFLISALGGTAVTSGCDGDAATSIAGRRMGRCMMGLGLALRARTSACCGRWRREL